MRLVQKLYLSFGILLGIALLSVAMAVWSGHESTYHLERTHLAHRQYEALLLLSSHTYQLFKQFGDGMLIGDRDRGTGESQLLEKIRTEIAKIRNIIGQEIDLVGQEEIDELDTVAMIEIQIDSLLAEYSLILESSNETGFVSDWGRLSRMLDQKIDRDFNALIQDALNEEAEEVRETREETLDRIKFFNIVAGMFAVVAIGAAAVSVSVLVHDIRHPIAKLLRGAQAFARGDLRYRVEAGRHSELEDVGRAFNSMADEISVRENILSQSNVRLEKAVAERTSELERVLRQLKTNEENRRRLLADVSHELRTPLTIIRGEADIALRGGIKPPDVYREALEKSRDAANHTARLVDDLLFVARREAGETPLRIEEVDLSRAIPEIIDEHRSLADGRGGTISFFSDVDKAIVRGDGDRIRQVVVILLENALRYGEDRVEVRLHGAPSGYAISVTDNGPGMIEEEQVRAFERFFRGSNAAERYHKGAGLGLPVAKAIVEAHGGNIAINSAPGEGTVASFSLPARPRLEAVS